MNQPEIELITKLASLPIPPEEIPAVLTLVNAVVAAAPCPLRHRGKPAPAEPPKPAKKARKVRGPNKPRKVTGGDEFVLTGAKLPEA